MAYNKSCDLLFKTNGTLAFKICMVSSVRMRMETMRNILPTSASICCHTDIVHICPLPEGEHRGTRYVWVHAKIRPWGHQLPVQCPMCWCIRPWVSKSQALAEFFACEHCNHWLTFSPPPDKHNWVEGAVFGGRWLAVDHLA